MEIAKKPEALAKACRDVIRMINTAKRLNLRYGMDIEEMSTAVEELAQAKLALDPSKSIKSLRVGQEWYVSMLCDFLGLTPEEQLEACYQQAFAEKANEAEMLEYIRALNAA